MQPVQDVTQPKVKNQLSVHNSQIRPCLCELYSVCTQFRAISFYCSLQGKNGSFFLNCRSSTAASQHEIHGGNYMLISHLTSLVSCKNSTRVLEWAHGTVGKLGNKITVTTSLSSIYYSAELRSISRG